MKTAEEILNQVRNRVIPSTLKDRDIIEIAETYANQFKPKWVSVKDKIPETVTSFTTYSRSKLLLYCTNDGRIKLGWAEVYTQRVAGHEIGEVEFGDLTGRVDEITHWILVPELPNS